MSDEKMRSEFEAWYCKKFTFENMARREDGTYRGEHAFNSWVSWQAALSQSEQVLNMVWIPVSQRIPDDNDLVLTIDKNGVQLVAFHDENMWVTSFDDGLEITHWQELPSAPKGEE